MDRRQLLPVLLTLGLIATAYLPAPFLFNTSQRQPSSDQSFQLSQLPPLNCDPDLALEPPVDYPQAKTEELGREFRGPLVLSGWLDFPSVHKVHRARVGGALRGHEIHEVLDVRGESWELNFQNMGQFRHIQVGSLRLVGSRLRILESASGQICASLNEVGQIERMAGSLGLWGRGRGEDLSQIKLIADLSGYLELHDFQVQHIHGLSGTAQLHRSRIRVLSSGSGTLILDASTVEKIDSFSGVILLKRGGKIKQLPDNFKGHIVHL
jgi:hypothetical protein